MAVTIDAGLLEILACPSPDHAPLTPGSPDDPDADALTCTACGRVFPVRDGIPVLLLDEATPPTKGDERESRDESSPDGA
ncbi:hypothetical protein FHU38_001090 [Saccharomonospora amisosensis]|uniref:UPF0434 protein FHU38_001090 n=1 Tax=Saccharomonospora amisosensis TaxID=1128677 RepID=A0A7X5UMI7_9PSEU|nr:Trm112 family protein [Saccharomonospora amisosensis]NIJ10746.1 hypothetical protein [Saccharomonospora amisosensis]